MIVLLPNCGFLSETSRMLAIAQALQARGEAVAIATHGGAYTRVLDDAGLPWTLLPPVMDAERSARYLHDLVRIGKPGVRLQSADEVRRSVAAEVDFSARWGRARWWRTVRARGLARGAGALVIGAHQGGGEGVASRQHQMTAPRSSSTPWRPTARGATLGLLRRFERRVPARHAAGVHRAAVSRRPRRPFSTAVSPPPWWCCRPPACRCCAR